MISETAPTNPYATELRPVPEAIVARHRSLGLPREPR
jgi:hypothetical protein